MRVTFQHREERTLGGKTHYVDCTVQFSEEEKAVIREREFGRGLHFGSPRPPAHLTTISTILSTFWAIASNIHFVWLMMMITGFIWAVTAIRGSTSIISPLLFFGAPALYPVAKFMFYRDEHSMDEKLVTFENMFAGRPFTVWALNPSDAKDKEKEIEQKFAGLKHYIKENIEVGQKRTVEL